MRFLKNYNWLLSAFIPAVLLVVSSCKNDDNELGLNLQPAKDKLNVFSTDTTKVVAYSQLVDSVKTDESSVSLLGSLLDPVFGKSTASFYTQIRLSKTSHSFGENPVLDSLILTLDYEGQYGDTNAELTVKVYEIAEKFFIDSNYYSNMSLEVNETLLGQLTFIPDYSSDVVIEDDTLDPHLRINLGNITTALADKLFNAPADSMETNENFQNYFYGLYVTVEPVSHGGQIIYFNLLSSLSQLTMYYRNDEDDSLGFAYIINSNCARFAHFDHDYTLGGPGFRAQVLDNDTTIGKQVCYVQALAGVKTFVRFPNIKNFYNDGSIAVNEARLFIKVLEIDPELSPAKNLVIVNKLDSGAYSITEDQLQGYDYYGGYYDEDDHGYWFRITMTVQDMMRATEPDKGLELYLSGGAVNAQRVVLTGTDPLTPMLAEDRIKLVITYTKL